MVTDRGRGGGGGGGIIAKLFKTQTFCQHRKITFFLRFHDSSGTLQVSSVGSTKNMVRKCVTGIFIIRFEKFEVLLSRFVIMCSVFMSSQQFNVTEGIAR